MRNAVISDASCLIVLSKVNALVLLDSVFDSVTTTPEVAAEVGFGLPSWIHIRSVQDRKPIAAMPSSIDQGEASAIALALESNNTTLILDDLSARKYATGLGLSVTGTVGILIRAKADGHIALIRPFVDAIQRSGLYLSERVIQNALEITGED